MSQTTAIAHGPISYFTSTGQRQIIPIGLISFNDGAIEIAGGPPYDTPEILGWLSHLHDLGILREGDAPAALAAMNMQASNAGMWGNETKVVIARPSSTTFDITVTAKCKYEGLEIADIAARLGTSTATGSHPGPAYAAITGTPALPANGSTSFAGGDTVTSAAAAATIVTGLVLHAKVVGDAGNHLAAAVSDVDATAGTFTLEVTFQDSATSQTLAGMSALGAKFNQALSLSAPTSGYGLPAAGTYLLRGGLDIATASGVVFTKP